LCNNDPHDDDAFMLAAIREAEQARNDGEVPVGAVVSLDGRIIGRGFNQRESLNDPTAHAEMIAITAAAAEMGDWRLSGCTLYVTLEPCLMCAGAAILARIDRLVYGATDPKAGACESLYAVTTDERLNHQVTVEAGLMGEECALLLRSFFAEQRAQGKK
jgi:tRNA(adenine34) deaminase